jgi:hypothetical protein
MVKHYVIHVLRVTLFLYNLGEPNALNAKMVKQNKMKPVVNTVLPARIGHH